MKEPEGPTFKEKLAFWIVLSMISVFFAEVISGSQPFALVIPWNLLVLILVYGLHTLILATLVFRGKPIFGSLFAAGCIFGLYEAYITKVLFEPPWGASSLRYLGVDFMWILILVLWWHVFFSFIIPLLVGEFMLTRSKEVLGAMPGPIGRALTRKKGFLTFLFLIVIWAALFMGGNMPAFWAAPVSIGANLAVLVPAVMIYRSRIGPKYTLRELLPDGKEFWALFSILFFMYILFGFIWSPERLPPPEGHLIMLGLYLLFFILLQRNINKSGGSSGDRIKEEVKWRIPPYIAFLLFIVFSILSVTIGITGIGVVFMLLSFLLGIVLGALSLVHTVYHSIAK